MKLDINLIKFAIALAVGAFTFGTYLGSYDARIQILESNIEINRISILDINRDVDELKSAHYFYECYLKGSCSNHNETN